MDSDLSSKKKIIWAIDAFEDDKVSRLNLILALKHLASQRPISIEPVYVLTPTDSESNTEETKLWLQHYRPSAEKVLKGVVDEISIDGLLPPIVITHSRPNREQTVQALANYAEDSNADWIIISTHARQGLTRLFLGSFAETLLLYAKTPVVVVGPRAVHTQINQILFATDLSDKANLIFENVLKIAVDLKAKITVFHSLSLSLSPLLQSGVSLMGGGWVTPPDFMGPVESEKQKLAEKWIARALEKGIIANYSLSMGEGSASQAILKEAEIKNIGLIALAAESGAAEAAVIGSITRQVVREAPCPVWVMRTE
ncbi:MAG: universal stress protein [Bdellovibrionia bacterium]